MAVDDPFAHLTTMNCAGLPSFFPESVRVRDAVIGLDADKTALIESKTRTFLDAMPATSASATLTRLPRDGESMHIVSRGLWPAFDLIPVAMRLAAPATIDSLHIATLSLSRENVDQMLFLMDAGAIRFVCMIVSCYFRSTEQGIVDRIAREFEARKQRFAVRRCHAKIIGMEFTDGCCITSESSANLRSSRNIEQFTVTHSRPLLEFHRGWMNEVAAAGNQK